MTQNQLKYLELQEAQRSNLERERQGRDTIAETYRNNLTVSNETNRHNLVTENQYLLNLQEQRRSNMANEDIGRVRNSLTQEMNAITNAHYNRMDSTNYYSAYEQAQHLRRNDATTAQHYQNIDAELVRNNLANNYLGLFDAQNAQDRNLSYAESVRNQKEYWDKSAANAFLGAAAQGSQAGSAASQAGTAKARQESDAARNSNENTRSWFRNVVDVANTINSYIRLIPGI